MQHLLLALSMILLIAIARNTIDKQSQQPTVVKEESKLPESTIITSFDEKLSIKYCIYDMTVD